MMLRLIKKTMKILMEAATPKWTKASDEVSMNVAKPKAVVALVKKATPPIFLIVCSNAE